MYIIPGLDLVFQPLASIIITSLCQRILRQLSSMCNYQSGDFTIKMSEEGVFCIYIYTTNQCLCNYHPVCNEEMHCLKLTVRRCNSAWVRKVRLATQAVLVKSFRVPRCTLQTQTICKLLYYYSFYEGKLMYMQCVLLLAKNPATLSVKASQSIRSSCLGNKHVTWRQPAQGQCHCITFTISKFLSLVFKMRPLPPKKRLYFCKFSDKNVWSAIAWHLHLLEGFAFELMLFNGAWFQWGHSAPWTTPLIPKGRTSQSGTRC